MPTQEERLTALEQAQAKFGEAVGDLNHHVTILIGVVSREEWDIREMKISLRAIEGRLGTLEGSMGALEGRLGTLEGSMGALEGRLGTLEGSMGALEGRLGTLEGSMGALEGRMGSLEGHFETQEKKLDQVLLLLNTFTPKPE
jgi:chromosome segregation ATPase